MTNTMMDFEYLLISKSAPTLAKSKSGSLFSVSNSEDIFPLILNYNQLLNQHDIYIELLCSCKKRLLVYVYHKQLLKKSLNNPLARSFLCDTGYTDFASLEVVLSHLKKRIALCDSFPHEIGMFLDYPLHDVVGFIQNNGRNYVITGYWKVYQNKHYAIEKFNLYDTCKQDFCSRLKSGESLTQILNAV